MSNQYVYSAKQHSDFLQKHNVLKAANFLEFVSAPQFLGQSVIWEKMSTASVMDYAHKITFFQNSVMGDVNYYEALFLYAIHTQITTLNFHEHNAQPKHLYLCRTERAYMFNRFKDIFRDSPWFSNLLKSLAEYNSNSFKALTIKDCDMEFSLCGNLVIRFVGAINTDNDLRLMRGKFIVGILNFQSSLFPSVKLPYEKPRLIYDKFLSENVDPADLPYLPYINACLE